jgi:hypothetical protein
MKIHIIKYTSLIHVLPQFFCPVLPVASNRRLMMMKTLPVCLGALGRGGIIIIIIIIIMCS